MNNTENNSPIACSDCFCDTGLSIDATSIGLMIKCVCPNCGSCNGKKLSREKLEELAYRFFTWGSIMRFKYGASPRIKFNVYQETSIHLNEALRSDVKIFEKYLGIGFFYYGPRAWMYGEIEPLKDLQNENTRDRIITRIIEEYPAITITKNDPYFYRVRKEPSSPLDPDQYDSPPCNLAGNGRLDKCGKPVLYASPDLETCIHECRFTVDDTLYVATLAPAKSLRLLNLSALLKEESVTEFESLDHAIYMLFMAGNHSYDITRAISVGIQNAGFDGIIYPSYYGMIRQGLFPFEASIYGISNRRVPQFQPIIETTTVQNLAIFGRPINQNKVIVKCINRLCVTNASYRYVFGPIIDEPLPG